MSAFLISFALGTALIFVILDDLKNFRIRNEAVIFMAVLFLADAITRGQYHDTLAHLSFGGIMFLLIIAIYALGMMGGGDAKLLAVAFLWLGVGAATIFSALLLILTLVYWLGAYARVFPKQIVAGRMKIPYGPAIASAWLLTAALQK
jgi:prepilin peptidase CpaA